MPLLCKDPQRRPSGQSVCDEHSVEAEMQAKDMSRWMSNVRVAIEGELQT